MKDLLIQAVELKKRREPFALATVVRCQRPTSARPGARALIYHDGRLEGWVGGSCAQPIVVREALRAIELGRPRLVRLRGSGEPVSPGDDDAVEYPMTCHSGGTLEIYVEPHLPPPRLVVVGQAPVARALSSLASFLGYEVAAVAPDATPEALPGAGRVVQRLDELRADLDRRTCLVVASHGDYDEQALEQAAAADLAYVALIASPRRAAVLRRYLVERGLPEAAVARIRAPAGLDIGAVEPEEIALSIMAEVVQVRHQAAEPTAQTPAEPAPAVDPICGMMVDPATARHSTVVDGQTTYFCCSGCQQRYEAARAAPPPAGRGQG